MRYLKLSYASLNVTDVRRSYDFYKDIVGLHPTEELTEQQAFFTGSNSHYDLILNQAAQPGLDRVAFEMENAAELEQAFEHLTKLGVAPQEVSKEECNRLTLNGAFRFKDPNNYTIELHNGMMEHHEDIYRPWPIKINRLGHVVVNTPNFEETLKFYTEVLNFKVSDMKYGSGGKVSFAFMRCFPSPYHHSFAVTEDTRNFFHVAFMVNDIDDIGRGVNHLKKHNLEMHGPGRHVASGSIFLYYKDPDGLMVEYTLGMEEFPEHNPRKPRILDGTPYTSNMWLV